MTTAVKSKFDWNDLIRQPGGADKIRAIAAAAVPWVPTASSGKTSRGSGGGNASRKRASTPPRRRLLSVGTVQSAAHGRWFSHIFPVLAPLLPTDSFHWTDPKNGGGDGPGGSFGNGINLLCRLNGWGFDRTLEEIAKILPEDAFAEAASKGSGSPRSTPDTEGGEDHNEADEPTEPDNRPVIQIQLPLIESDIQDEVVRQGIAFHPDIYQQGDRLVHLVPVDGENRLPVIVAITESILRRFITQSVRLVEVREGKNGEEIEKDVRPPAWLVDAILDLKHWPGVRPINRVVDRPIPREDGSIFRGPGYDPATGVFLVPLVDVPLVSDQPTKAEIETAKAPINELLIDFPLATPADHAAAVSCLLTLLARDAFSGQAPCFMANGNVRGSGKSLLMDGFVMIATGRPAARYSLGENNTESEKRVTALAMEGPLYAFLDNLNTFGGEAVDRAMTSEIWKGRDLGRSKNVTLPLRMVWLATANNIRIQADSIRRICPIRLKSPLENPELRENFKHPNLLEFVRQNRGQLIWAALTILRGYIAAGRPQAPLRAWGSFEGWSSLIRQAVYWAWGHDAGDTRADLAESADVESNAVAALVEHWESIDPDGHGVTAGEILRRMSDNYLTSGVESFKDSLLELIPTPPGKLPTSRAIGIKLSANKDRVFGGKSICRRTLHGQTVWFLSIVRGGLSGLGGSSFIPPEEDKKKDKEIDSSSTHHSDIEGRKNYPTQSTQPTPVNNNATIPGGGVGSGASFLAAEPAPALAATAEPGPAPASGTIRPPAGTTCYALAAGHQHEVRPGGPLPPATSSWTHAGAPEWFSPDRWPW